MGQVPRARYRCSGVVVDDSGSDSASESGSDSGSEGEGGGLQDNAKMLIFGGHDGTRHLNDTYCYHFGTMRWELIVPYGVAPSPRDSYVAVVVRYERKRRLPIHITLNKRLETEEWTLDG